tara:strand:- start:1454 stop:1786 length:333 start_codon:yes stop_codon:yes gene_type:complete
MYAKIENNIVTYITPYAEEGCVEVPEGTVPSQIKQADGTFINPPISFQSAMANLRMDRNSLLRETDYLALSDQTISAEMTTYRQALRDITNGLTTVEDVEAVVFPEKPEV